MDSWYKLRVAGVKDCIIKKLMSVFTSYEEIFNHNSDYYKKYFNLKELDITKIFDSYKLNIDFHIEKILSLDIEVVSIKESSYPLYLKNISHPPLFLYMKGKKIFPEKNIAVVGTRKMSAYGEEICKSIVTNLVKSDVTITSGLATGIDVTAHKSALDLGGNTIAVVGSGLDIIYPPKNKYQWDMISREGTLISEYPLGTPPYNFNFPVRNRIIVGLSRGVALIESYKKGGSLITAKLALEEGRDLFVIPGFPNQLSFEGNNNLIKDLYGKLITCSQDILDEYNWNNNNKHNNKQKSNNLSREEEMIYNLLNMEKNLEEIMYETNLAIGTLLAILTNLELNRLIKALPGGKYKKL